VAEPGRISPLLFLVPPRIGSKLTRMGKKGTRTHQDGKYWFKPNDLPKTRPALTKKLRVEFFSSIHPSNINDMSLFRKEDERTVEINLRSCYTNVENLNKFFKSLSFSTRDDAIYFFMVTYNMELNLF
jgi:hypothetical protein